MNEMFILAYFIKMLGKQIDIECNTVTIIINIIFLLTILHNVQYRWTFMI